MKKYQELQKEVERLKKEEEANKLPENFMREYAIEFLTNFDPNDLNPAFTWDRTPQGGDYWCHIFDCLCENNKNYKVPQEAIVQIQSWVIESYKQQYGV